MKQLHEDTGKKSGT